MESEETIDMEHHYLTVSAPGRLMMLRVPWPMPRWRSIVTALTPLMRERGLRAKDVDGIDGVVSYPDDRNVDERDLAGRIDRAYSGDPSVLPKFWMYDWSRDRFRLARAGTS